MSEPTWQSPDGAIQLYHGDCLDILPQLGTVLYRSTGPAATQDKPPC